MPAPKESDITCEMETKDNFAILGTSIGHGQPKPGVEKAYRYLKDIGFWDSLKEKSDYVDFGELAHVGADEAYNNLFHKTLEILNRGFKPLLIGGDHSQAFASISALTNKHPNLRIIWVDAHADMNTPETSPSGNSHGMPLSGLFGWVDKNIWGMPWMNQLLKPEQVAQFGIRDIHDGERRLIHQHNIEYYSPESMREKGLSTILDELSKKWQGHPLHLSFDIDGLDSSVVPATGTPVSNGLSLEEGRQIIQTCKEKFQLVSAEVVEFNPEIAKNPEGLVTTENTVKTLVEEILA